MRRIIMAFPQIRESRGPAYGPGRRGARHPAIRRQRFPGELALADLRPGGDADSAMRALARFAAVRYAGLVIEGAPDLAEERKAATEYVDFAVQVMDPSSAGSLRGLLALDQESPPLEVARWLLRAGADADAQTATGAAAACWRLAYPLAADAGEWEAAAQAAESLAATAERDGAAAAVEIWAHRARRMRKRLAT